MVEHADGEGLPTSGVSVSSPAMPCTHLLSAAASPWCGFLRETMGWKSEVVSSAQAFMLRGNGLSHYH